jgi:uncharacterized membrane protein
MYVEIVVLRLIHILGGVFWVGSGLFMTLFLLPALAQSGPSAGPVFAALQQRRLLTVLPSVAVLTILSGLRLMWIASMGFSSAYFASAAGRTFAIGGTAATLALLIGMTVARPAATRAATLSASIASAPADQRANLAAEVARLRRRGSVAGTVVLVLLVVGAGAMAVARYLN